MKQQTPLGWFVIGLAALAVVVVLVTLAGCADDPVIPRAEATVLDAAPPQSQRYKAIIIREARLVWGLDAPTAALAAQLQQESDFRPDVSSKYASGIAQFTPATAREMARLYPELGDPDVFNPEWGIRAQNRYMFRLRGQIKPFPGGSELTECHRYSMALASYNGGPGGLRSDRDYAAETGRDPNQWYGQTELLSRKADWAYRENRGYVKRVIRVLQPLYKTWPGRYVCPELG